MFKSDWTPILISRPEWDKTTIYFIHDIHYGSAEFNAKKWQRFKDRITGDPFALVCWIGDVFENAIPGSKGDMFTQTANPQQQKEWAVEQMADLAAQTIAVVPGNHEYNRSTKAAGLYPLYDVCLLAGTSDKYRDTFAFIDIGVGKRPQDKRQEIHYIGQIQHRAKDIKSVSSADYTDGIDFFAYGHDHDPKDHPRAKLVYNTYQKCVAKRNIEVINSGSFLQYGGYGSRSAYRPQSDKMYSLTLDGTKRSMQTIGFYPD